MGLETQQFTPHLSLMTVSRFLQLSHAWVIWGFIKPRLIWLLVGARIAASLVLCWGSELVFRSYGYGLQMIGAFFAAKEVFSNERLFQQPAYGITFPNGGAVGQERFNRPRCEAWILEQAGITFDAKAEPGKLRAVS